MLLSQDLETTRLKFLTKLALTGFTAIVVILLSGQVIVDALTSVKLTLTTYVTFTVELVPTVP